MSFGLKTYLLFPGFKTLPSFITSYSILQGWAHLPLLPLLPPMYALLLVSCGQDTDVKFAGDEGAKVTFSASINEQNSQDVSRVTGVTWDDGDEVSISCGPTQKNVFYRYNAADNYGA